MTTPSPIEQSLSVLEARLRAGAAPRPRQAAAPFITLSRETGAGGTSVGRMLVSILDVDGGDGRWVFLDKELLATALERQHLPAQLAGFLPEDKLSEIRGAIGELVGIHPPLWNLQAKVAEAILQLAHVGHVILAGRGAHRITADLAGGLHVRLVAPFEVRVRRVATLLGLDATAAEAHTLKTDQARRRFVRSYFEADPEDAHDYDLVINTARIPYASAAALIADALRHKMEALRRGA